MHINIETGFILNVSKRVPLYDNYILWYEINKLKAFEAHKPTKSSTYCAFNVQFRLKFQNLFASDSIPSILSG